MAIVKDLIVLGETNGIGKTQSAEFIEGGVSLIDKYLTSAAAATNLSNYITSANVVTALNNKVDKVSGKGLSTNDFTDVYKGKLDGIASGAEVNVQSDWLVTATTDDSFIKNKPTKLSNFTNDTGFINSGVTALKNFATSANVVTALNKYLPLSGGTLTGDLYINKDTDASGTNSAGSLVVGTKTSVNVAIDANEIMARNNNAPSTLYINEDGGNIVMMGNDSSSYHVGIGTSSPTSRLHVNGNIRTNNDLYIGSASTVQCHQQYDNTNKCLKFIFD